jgi:hypothetical protein
MGANQSYPPLTWASQWLLRCLRFTPPLVGRPPKETDLGGHLSGSLATIIQP